ncbi:hypothetical protein [Sphingorhabdus sp.]|jgi:hypothetical protein|uniref:hypothetical protein n=1 Tax=Sphingorhabdus sp. TaxID=1902408 RepID=UPI0037CADEBC
MTDFQTATATSRRGFTFKHIMLLILCAFVGGAIVAYVIADKYGFLTPSDAPVAAESSTGAAGNVATTDASVIAQPVTDQMVPTFPSPNMLSPEAARADGLLLIYAVRRTIDKGAPLGALAEQLRLRFGATQPQSVAAVLSAGQAPVTIDALKTELRGLVPVLLTGNRDDSTWATVKRELSELFVLRKENGPSLAPNERLIRAEALVDAGKLDLAVEEVAALPGASIAQSWIARAKRFSDARKALDRLEQVAILQPVAVPVIVAPSVETAPSNVPVPTP